MKFYIILIFSIVLAGYCVKNIQGNPASTNYKVNSDYKKPYQCKKIDFYKNAKLDYTPKGKCAEITNFPNDIPLEVHTNRELAKKYFANKDFPGKISSSIKRETIEIELQYPLPLWLISTGAYAAPNEEIELEVPEELLKYNLQIQIGIHSDNISHVNGALRDGVIIAKKKIENKITKFKNKRGGPILLETRLIFSNKEEVPWWKQDSAIREKTLLQENYKITLRNIIRAPKFILGKTNPQEWVNEERCNPAPWAELEGKNITIAVPSSAIRNLNNPEPVLKFWDAAIKSIAELSGKEDLIHLIRERFVTDIELSMGYMHSGYPIVTFMDMSQHVIDQEPKDKSQPWSPENSALMSDYTLGHFHELAHNRQTNDPWITADLGEWSTNIFVMKANCELKGLNPGNIFQKYGHNPKYEALRYFNEDDSVINKELRKKWKNKYAGIADKSIPNLFYIHLYNNFGFDIYKNIITHYQKIKQEEWDKNHSCKHNKKIECNLNKLNSFALEFSKITGKDMTDYLNGWGYELAWGAEEIKNLNLPKFEPIPILAESDLGSMPLKEEIFFDIASLKSNGSLTINIKGRASWDGAEIFIWNREFNAGNTMFQFKKIENSDFAYQIIGKDSNRCIGLDKEEKNITLRDCNSSSMSQQWKLELFNYAGFPFYTLYNIEKKKYLSIQKDKPESGTKLEFSSKINKLSGSELWILNSQ